MKPAFLAAVVSALILSGCAQPQQLLLAGFDGAPVDPAKQDQAIAECRGRATTVSANIPYSYGSYGALARSYEQEETKKAAFEGCLAEKGIKATWGPVQTASAR